MAKQNYNFRCSILSPKNVIYDKEATSLFIMGDRSEYELLAYHYPLVGLVKEGDIVIDWKIRIPVQSGILRFFANECTILVEENERTAKALQKTMDKPANH